MSTLRESPPPPLPPQQRSGCATAFMVIAGIVLLLPGLCAVVFGVGTLTGSSYDPTVMLLVILGLILGFLGVLLIWNAIRGSQS
jgi:hypothetical protein